MGQLWDIVQAHIDSAPYPPSERQVAAKLGVSPTALSKWRAPKRLPDVENLRSLARLAGVPYSTVLEAALADTGYKEVVGNAEHPAPMNEAGATPAAGDSNVHEDVRDQGRAQGLRPVGAQVHPVMPHRTFTAHQRASPAARGEPGPLPRRGTGLPPGHAEAEAVELTP